MPENVPAGNRPAPAPGDADEGFHTPKTGAKPPPGVLKLVV